MFRFNSKNKSLSRVLVLALACLLVVTSLPAGTIRAFADETDGPTETGIVSEVPESDDAQENEAVLEGEGGAVLEGEGGAPSADVPDGTYLEEKSGMIDTALRIIDVKEAVEKAPAVVELKAGEEEDDEEDEDDEQDTAQTATVDITVKKVWDGDEHHLNERPSAITVILKADGEEVGTVMLGPNGEDPGVIKKVEEVALKSLRRDAKDGTAGAAWTYTFRGLPKLNDAGEEIVYTVEEPEIEHYVSAVTGNAEQGFTITNKFKYTDVYVLKVWDDNDDETGVRPETIDVKLLANGEELYTATVITENDQPTVRAPRRAIEVKAQAERILADVDGNEWYFMFAGVPRFDEAGNEIAYSVEEIVPEHYIATITQDTMTIEGKTYHYWRIENECTLTNVYVMKVWNDWDAPEDTRPESITVTLLADGEEVQTAEVAPRTPEEV